MEKTITLDLAKLNSDFQAAVPTHAAAAGDKLAKTEQRLGLTGAVGVGTAPPTDVTFCDAAKSVLATIDTALWLASFVLKSPAIGQARAWIASLGTNLLPMVCK